MTWICLVGPLPEGASGDPVLALRALLPSVDVSGLNHLDAAEINDSEKVRKTQRLVFHEAVRPMPIPFVSCRMTPSPARSCALVAHFPDAGPTAKV
eukprot:COSAG05_NODE_18074_length_314_cov_0.939535_1_plen_96_part_01